MCRVYYKKELLGIFGFEIWISLDKFYRLLNTNFLIISVYFLCKTENALFTSLNLIPYTSTSSMTCKHHYFGDSIGEKVKTVKVWVLICWYFCVCVVFWFVWFFFTQELSKMPLKYLPSSRWIGWQYKAKAFWSLCLASLLKLILSF